jgi:thioredoxin 1
MQSLSAYLADAPDRQALDALSGTTLLVFGANWCGHCQAAQAALQEVCHGRPDIRLIQTEDGKGRPLGRSYSVKLWPTVIVLSNGREVARVVRPTTASQLESALATAGVSP